jgi:hypothetical protein
MDFQITPIANIEKTARMAADVGLDSSANPHEEGSDEFYQWLHAYSERMKERCARVTA